MELTSQKTNGNQKESIGISIEENIRILEQGITLQQFSGMQEQLAIDGSMDAYHK